MASKEWRALANVDGGRGPEVGRIECRFERKGPVQRPALESATNSGAARSYGCFAQRTAHGPTRRFGQMVGYSETEVGERAGRHIGNDQSRSVYRLRSDQATRRLRPPLRISGGQGSENGRSGKRRIGLASWLQSARPCRFRPASPSARSRRKHCSRRVSSCAGQSAFLLHLFGGQYFAAVLSDGRALRRYSRMGLP
jgi:hypothetical protein